MRISTLKTMTSTCSKIVRRTPVVCRLYSFPNASHLSFPTTRSRHPSISLHRHINEVVQQ